MPQVDWDARYETGDTPWEKGEPHPALPSFLPIHRGLFSAEKHVLIPGCGFGHDAAIIANSVKSVTALDIASEPIESAGKLHPAENIDWQVGDFFTWQDQHANAYDLIWEHTCFCAIPLEMRQSYAESAARLLRPHGLLAGIFFLNPDHPLEEGPPFGVTREELHQHFAPYFELLWDLPPRATYEGRENREALLLWRLKSGVTI